MSRAEIKGVDEVIALLKGKAPRIARNLLRSTVQGVASSAAKEVKASAPELSGGLKKSVKAKRLNRRGKGGNVVASAVTINAKTPATTDRPDGTFQWLHVEYGTQEAEAHPFVEPVAVKLRNNMPKIFRDEFLKKLAKQMARELKTVK